MDSPGRERLAEDLVRLASADNFRDVAGPGYRSAAGRPLVAGVLFRSNELQLSEEDAATLAGLAIGAVFDLRDAHEVEAHPDPAVPGATWEHLEVNGLAPGAGEQLQDEAEAQATMRAVYRRFVTDPAARASFGTLLRRLADATTPQLFHCTAGKDRTGWAAALCLHVAGVERDVVEADYLLTNTTSSRTRERYLGLIAEHLGADRVPTFERIMAADLDYLHCAYAQVEQSYGSLAAYLREGLGLDDDARRRLHDRLVAPLG